MRAAAWMLAIFLSAKLAAADKPPEPALYMVVSIDPGATGLRQPLKDEIQNVGREKLQPYVEFWAPWCKTCEVMKQILGDPAMRDALRGTYLIMLNVDDWGRHLRGSGFDPTSIPTSYDLRSDGAPTGRMMDARLWGADRPENMARWLFHPR